MCTLGRTESQPPLFLFPISFFLFHVLFSIFHSLSPQFWSLFVFSHFLSSWSFFSFSSQPILRLRFNAQNVHSQKFLLTYLMSLFCLVIWKCLCLLIQFSPFLPPLPYPYSFIRLRYLKARKMSWPCFLQLKLDIISLFAKKRISCELTGVSFVWMFHSSLTTLFGCEECTLCSNYIVCTNICNRVWSWELQSSAHNDCFAHFSESNFRIFFSLSQVNSSWSCKTHKNLNRLLIVDTRPNSFKHLPAPSTVTSISSLLSFSVPFLLPSTLFHYILQ